MDTLVRIERAEKELKLAKEQLESEKDSNDAKYIMKQLGEFYTVKLIEEDPHYNNGNHKIVINIEVSNDSHTSIITNFERIDKLGYYIGNIGRFDGYIQLRFFKRK